MRKSCFFLLLLFLPLSFGINACGLPEELDEANKIVKDGIEKMKQESEKWREIMEFEMIPAIESLDGHFEDLVFTLNALKNSAIADIENGAQCVADAIPQKVVRALNDIVSNFDGRRRTSFVYPTACTVNPGVVDLDVPQHLRRSMNITGYDFVEAAELDLWLLDTNGQTHIVREPRLFKQTDYRLTVNIADWDDTLEQYSAIIITYGGETLATVAILK